MPAGKKLDDWTFDGNPANNRLDKIRILVGDTDEDLNLIEDSVIDFRMAQSDNDDYVAGLVCKDIAARYMKYATSKSAKGYSESFGGIYAAYAAKATELISQSSLAIPSAPQLRFSTRRPFKQDTDLKQPQFAVGMLSEDTKAIDTEGVEEFNKSLGVE